MAAELRTYGDAGVVTDVQAEIELLTPVENFVLRNARSASAKSMVHQWQDDTLAAAASAVVNEYHAFSPDTLTTPSLRTNLVEHVVRSVSVTTGQQMVSHYSGENEYSRQVAKKMKEWSNAAEFDLVRSSLVSGASGTSPRMNGVIQTITSNATAQTSGTVFSESILIGLLKLTWDNSSGESATDVLVGSNLKSKISAFTAGITKNVQNEANKAGVMVQMYESDYGTVSIHLHRYVQQSGDATARILGVNMSKLHVARLNGEGAKLVEQGIRATSRDSIIEGFLTLENRQQQAGFFAHGFLNTL